MAPSEAGVPMDRGTGRKAAGLRAPDFVMRLSRLGAFHQTRLSFLRALLRQIAREQWQYQRMAFAIDDDGVGHAVYTISRAGRCYSLVAFAHDLPPDKRTDRVIADAWDATFALFDGVPGEGDIVRLAQNVPLQEAGRCRQSELVLARANRSVRLFDAVVAALAQGRQPDRDMVEATGYLMRTTAVYGNGKFGIADREVFCDRPELAGPFRAEMLTVWLIRAFTVDLVEHLARVRQPGTAVTLEGELRRCLGIGNATGLGMAPFLIRHPTLIGRWIEAREEALRRVRALACADDATIASFLNVVRRARASLSDWRTDDPVQAPRIAGLLSDIDRIASRCDAGLPGTSYPWDALYRWGQKVLSIEGQEFLVTLLIEPHGEIVDDLADEMGADETADPKISDLATTAGLARQIEIHYAWALGIDFALPEANTRFWYVSQEKLEPRLGMRRSEPGSELEQPLTVARDVQRLYLTLRATAEEGIATFLARNPEYRHVARRIARAESCPFAEIRDNLIAADLRAIDLLRCKLSFFGCTRFDPRSDKWLRITMYQGAPFPDEIGSGDWDSWIWGEEGDEP